VGKGERINHPVDGPMRAVAESLLRPGEPVHTSRQGGAMPGEACWQRASLTPHPAEPGRWAGLSQGHGRRDERLLQKLRGGPLRRLLKNLRSQSAEDAGSLRNPCNRESPADSARPRGACWVIKRGCCGSGSGAASPWGVRPACTLPARTGLGLACRRWESGLCCLPQLHASGAGRISSWVMARHRR
jgi:hypothetical protein